jgi:hypothetical protein
MRADQRSAHAVGGCERRVEPVVEAHEAPQPDGDGMRGAARVGVVVGQLEAGDHEQAVEPPRPLTFLRDPLQVLVVPLAREGGAAGAADVVGDREHVEARRAVEVDELAQGEGAVAEGRVRVKLAEQRRRHLLPCSSPPARSRRTDW